MTTLLLLLILSVDPVAPTMARKVIVDSVHDGDTIHGTIELWSDLKMIPKGGIRAALYDCWEIQRQREQVVGKISDAEIEKGIKARDDLIELLKHGQMYAEDSGQVDPHGRGSAVLWVLSDGKWIWLAGWMRDRGHLRVPLPKHD